MTQIVVNVLYHAPADPAAFEAYYFGTHMPIAGKIPSVDKVVLLKGLPGPDGSAPPYYRLTQIWFADAETMAAAMASAEAQAATGDIPNFATGGATILVTQAA
ncbi:MAG: hypothetical protein RIS85_1592 [Pseudomonadota bacterium]